MSVTVLGVNGNQIRLGIDAPKSVPVHREEIFQKIADKKSDGSEAPAELPAVIVEFKRSRRPTGT